MVRSAFIETNGSSYPQTMHDLVQSSKCDFTILGNFGTCQGVEALQLLLMVMSISHNFGKPPKLNQIWFLSHNPSICMVSLDVNYHVKNIWNFGCDLSIFKILLTIEFTNLLQFMRHHANTSHQTQVGNSRLL